MSKHSCESVNT